MPSYTSSNGAFSVTWTASAATESIVFDLSCATTGYCAIGFSDSGSFHDGGDTVALFINGGGKLKAIEGVSAAEDEQPDTRTNDKAYTLLSGSHAGRLEVSVSRPWVAGTVDIVDAVQTMYYSLGAEDPDNAEYEKHDSKSSFSTNFLSEDEPVIEPPGGGDGGGSSNAHFASSDGSFAASWTLDLEAGTISFALSCATEGYCAIGLSDGSTFHSEGECATGWVDGASAPQLLEGASSAEEQPALLDPGVFSLDGGSTLDGRTYLQLTRPLDVVGGGVAVQDAVQSVFYSVGAADPSGGVYEEHLTSGFFTTNLRDPASAVLEGGVLDGLDPGSQLLLTLIIPLLLLALFRFASKARKARLPPVTLDIVSEGGAAASADVPYKGEARGGEEARGGFRGGRRVRPENDDDDDDDDDDYNEEEEKSQDAGGPAGAAGAAGRGVGDMAVKRKPPLRRSTVTLQKGFYGKDSTTRAQRMGEALSSLKARASKKKGRAATALSSTVSSSGGSSSSSSSRARAGARAGASSGAAGGAKVRSPFRPKQFRVGRWHDLCMWSRRRIQGTHVTRGQVLGFIGVFALALLVAYPFRSAQVSAGAAWGYLCAAFSLLTVVCATRNSVLTWAFQMPVTGTLLYHRALGRLAFFSACMHLYHFVLEWRGDFGDRLGANGKHKLGLAAFFFLAVVWASSLAWVRRRAYHYFHAVHFSFLFFFLFGSLHSEYVAKLAIAAAVAYGVDVLLRAAFGMLPRRPTAAEALPGDVVRLRWDRNRFTSYKQAGQFVYVNVPGVSLTEWHPYSLASGPHEEHLEVFVKGSGDWSKRLARQAKVRQHSTKGKGAAGKGAAGKGAAALPRIRVDGPYGGITLPYKRYETLLLVGGGIGVTPLLSVLKSIFRIGASPASTKDFSPVVQNVHFVFVLPSAEPWQWFLDELAAVMARSDQPVHNSSRGHVRAHGSSIATSSKYRYPTLHLSGFFTRGAADVAGVEAALERKVAGGDAEFVGSLSVSDGRPDVVAVLQKVEATASAKPQRLAACACGPNTLVDTVWDATQKRSRGRYQYDFHREVFEL